MVETLTQVRPGIAVAPTRMVCIHIDKMKSEDSICFVAILLFETLDIDRHRLLL